MSPASAGRPLLHPQSTTTAINVIPHGEVSFAVALKGSDVAKRYHFCAIFARFPTVCAGWLLAFLLTSYG
jgi:hypothetical protein